MTDPSAASDWRPAATAAGAPDAPESVFEPVPLEPAPPPARNGRAGRDLPMAIAVGVGLVALVVAALLVVKVAFVVLACVALVLALWELGNAFAAKGIRLPVVPVAVGGVAMLVAAYVAGADALVVALGATVLATLAWGSRATRESYLRDATAGVFAAVYLPFLAGFAMLLLAAGDGPRRVLVFILLTVCSDVGGYATGVLAGRHPMAPTVSPKKSWEGFAGSVGACTIAGSLAVPWLLGGPAWVGALAGSAAAASATLGDLGESLLKRDLGIKDMGTLLPGHGGIMDRLDSLLPTAAVTWVLMTALLPR
ncbi:MAG: phosphatidate cytidylyltransferase [Actinomycetota bacterium]|nr:phosphatidate cytidylyltransferase [Actinomycetota bacterium]